jgi:hypothetical protein
MLITSAGLQVVCLQFFYANAVLTVFHAFYKLLRPVLLTLLHTDSLKKKIMKKKRQRS